MSSAFEQFDKLLAESVIARLGEEGSKRLAALHAARSAMPDADVYDRIRLARYILTGFEDAPEMMTVRTADGSVHAVYAEPQDRVEGVMPGEEPQEDPQPLTGVVGPDPAFEKLVEESEEQVPEREPAPSEGTGWLGRRGR